MYDGPSLRRELYNSKNITLYSFGSFPNISMMPGEKRTSYSLTASVMLGLSLPKNRVVGHYTNGSVFISPSNHFKILALLNTALMWFYDTNLYENLFYYDNDKNGILTLNNKDYNNLKIIEYLYTKKEQKSLAAMPIVVQSEADSRGVEGIALIFNESQSYAMLPYYEVQTLVSILTEFSFQQEIDIYLSMLNRIDNNKFTQGFDYTKNSTHQSRSFNTQKQIQW